MPTASWVAVSRGTHTTRSAASSPSRPCTALTWSPAPSGPRVTSPCQLVGSAPWSRAQGTATLFTLQQGGALPP
eukprot:2800221-Alexandrium_andersonii.AAC.1